MASLTKVPCLKQSLEFKSESATGNLLDLYMRNHKCFGRLYLAVARHIACSGWPQIITFQSMTINN